MTLTLSDPKPKRTAKRPADLDTLGKLVAYIEEMKDTRLDELVGELMRGDGLVLTQKGDATHVSLAGIKSSATAGRHQALTNWANAVRRNITKAGA